jgi:hypothetical protein
MADTPLYKVFFSRQNILHINSSIIDTVLNQLNIQIQPQNETSIQVLMLRVLDTMRPNMYDKNLLDKLNKEVVRQAFAQIKPQVLNYVFHQKNLGKLPTPMALPRNVRATGLKTGIMSIGTS